MSITINTKGFSELLGVKESELVHALNNGGLLFGVELPKPVEIANLKNNRSRKFYLDDAIEFKSRIKEFIKNAPKK